MKGVMKGAEGRVWRRPAGGMAGGQERERREALTGAGERDEDKLRAPDYLRRDRRRAARARAAQYSCTSGRCAAARGRVGRARVGGSGWADGGMPPHAISRAARAGGGRRAGEEVEADGGASDDDGADDDDGAADEAADERAAGADLTSLLSGTRAELAPLAPAAAAEAGRRSLLPPYPTARQSDTSAWRCASRPSATERFRHGFGSFWFLAQPRLPRF
jgi:hypothetical protein